MSEPQEVKTGAGAQICDREGNPVADSCASQGKLLGVLYGTAPGRAMLKVLTKPFVSYMAGFALDHPLSTAAIPPFVLKKHINLKEYTESKYRSFNAFFTRTVKPSARPVDMTPETLISPCDAKLTVVPVSEDTHFTVKGADYSLAAFVGCKKLAAKFRGGKVLIFRLTPDDYHRYCYPDACEIGKTRTIGISSEYADGHDAAHREFRHDAANRGRRDVRRKDRQSPARKAGCARHRKGLF